MKRERSTLEEARHLREEQDRAFAAAEHRDREKIIAQREKEAAARTAQREQDERAAREMAEKERADKEIAAERANRAMWRRYARKHLLPPNSGPLRVALRTPIDANRNVRQFTPGPSTEDLFIYAETLLIPDPDTPEFDPDSPPEGYTPPADFVIVSSYPRKEVLRVKEGGEAAWEMIRQTGGALFAEKKDGSRWGEKERQEDESSDEEVVDDSD